MKPDQLPVKSLGRVSGRRAGCGHYKSGVTPVNAKIAISAWYNPASQHLGRSASLLG